MYLKQARVLQGLWMLMSSIKQEGILMKPNNHNLKRQAKLYQFFKLMGLDFECLMTTKEGRTKIQDIVYLAEVQGIDLGYKFQWYSGSRG